MSVKRRSPRWIKILKWITGILLGLFVVLWALFRFGLGEFEMVDQESFDAYFQDKELQPSYHEYQVGGKTMHYVSIGRDTMPTILFIHGSPGSWDAYAAYLQDELLMTQARMITVDRIGYGKSEPGEAESSLEKQVAYLWPIVEAIPDSVPLLLVGHSYGGPVAIRMAMDHPKRVNGLMVLAGLADPQYEKRLLIQRYLRSPYLRWLLPPSLDVSNREIVPLKEELKAMVPYWESIQANSLIMQGTEDILVAYQHAGFAEKMLEHVAPSVTYMEGENHFFIWSKFEMVRDRIVELLGCIR